MQEVVDTGRDVVAVKWNPIRGTRSGCFVHANARQSLKTCFLNPRQCASNGLANMSMQEVLSRYSLLRKIALTL
jgi:hypothetical protein